MGAATQLSSGGRAGAKKSDAEWGRPKQAPSKGMEQGMIRAKPTFSQQRILRKMVATTVEKRRPVRLAVSVDAATGHFPVKSPVWVFRLGIQKYFGGTFARLGCPPKKY